MGAQFSPLTTYLRYWCVFDPSEQEQRIEVLASTRTAALVMGAELLDLPATTLRAIATQEWE